MDTHSTQGTPQTAASLSGVISLTGYSGPAYCDFIAFQIHDHLMDGQHPALIASVDTVEWDLHPTGGWMLSTKKTLNITDINGRRYRVTVEEV